VFAFLSIEFEEPIYVFFRKLMFFPSIRLWGSTRACCTVGCGHLMDNT